jgi:hypothetical protein
MLLHRFTFLQQQHYLLSHTVPQFCLFSITPPAVPLNPFSVPGDGIPRCSPMLDLISRPVLGWIIGCAPR